MILGAGIFRTHLPIGFSSAGINCGVRLYRPDLGMILSEKPCCAVGVFTQNVFCAATIHYCRELLPSTQIKAIITNSGEANAATGKVGMKRNALMAKSLAQALNCHSEQVLTASTGVIGKPLSIKKIIKAIPKLCQSTTRWAEKFALAILTTDLVPKTVFKKIMLSTGMVSITGICKGSGMIHPNMATMLGYLLTDVQLDNSNAQVILKDICDKSFNMISVDHEISTNDSVFLLANGMSGVKLKTSKDKKIFYDALLEVAITLAKNIVQDGEGATKLIQAQINGAKTENQAKIAARSIITSPLIKTAIYGRSPNWGRILSRLGSTGISASEINACQIKIQDINVIDNGLPIANLDTEKIKKKLSEETIEILVKLPLGNCGATAWGCDLTEKYIEINSGYLS